MSRKTVRIELPDGRPDDLIILGQKLTDKHTELGANSPLDETRMTKLAAALGIASQNNTAAKAADGVAQRARLARDTALGMAPVKTHRPKTRCCTSSPNRAMSCCSHMKTTRKR